MQENRSNALSVEKHWRDFATNDENRQHDELELIVLFAKDRIAAVRVEQRKIMLRATTRMRREQK